MKKIIIIIFLLTVSFTYGQNPLLIQDNTPIDYPKINAASIKEAVAEVMKSSDKRIADIVAAAGNQTLENTLFAYDYMQYVIGDLSSRIGLVSATYADDETRNVAFTENSNLSLYASNIYLNEPLYNAMIKFRDAKRDKPLSPSQTKFINDMHID